MSISVIFICYENICRSPMAEGIFSALLARYNLQHFFSVSSAGTISYQNGSRPDERAIEAVSSLGIDISSVRARCIEDLDMSTYDWIFVMDHENYDDICQHLIAHERPRVHMVMDFVSGRTGHEVPDPYYGTLKEFKQVMNDLVCASEQILHQMLEEYPHVAVQVSGS
ncbi:MAG: low molecular weight phosphotyrosine protein phosphatase [Chlorobiales bacterium]|nr:low molecular weight phosphotyrosine protein phosphatase [Chlorobiales bacterium]